MANIPAQQARAIFTSAYLEKYSDMANTQAPSFFKSFFNVVKKTTKTLKIEVQRGTEYIAVDVLRGAGPNRNTFSRATEKEYEPPFYNESFDATSLDRYDLLFGQSPTYDPATIGEIAMNAAEKYFELQKKIERAKELQCVQSLETGIVTLNNGDNIDYKRKAASLVDLLAGNYWSTSTADVEAQLIASAVFIRKYGKNSASEFNIVMSGSAFVYLKQTDYFKNLANYRQVQLIDIKMPQTQAWGAGYHGQIIAGAYKFNVWTYDEVYQAAGTGTITRYLSEEQAIVTPVAGTRFDLAHAGVPAIIRDTRNAEFPEYIKNVAAEYYFNNYIDKTGKSHTFEIMSAPLAIPVSVDMIYTMQVLP